jgi:hypothetical protein
MQTTITKRIIKGNNHRKNNKKGRRLLNMVFTSLPKISRKASKRDGKSPIEGGKCLECDFEPSFKERVNPRVSKGTV